MVSSDNEDICIAGSSTKAKVEVKLLAKFLSSILSLAVKNASAATITTYVRIFMFPWLPSRVG